MNLFIIEVFPTYQNKYLQIHLLIILSYTIVNMSKSSYYYKRDGSYSLKNKSRLERKRSDILKDEDFLVETLMNYTSMQVYMFL